MAQTIKIFDFLGAEARQRVSADKIRNEISDDKQVLLDFTDVTFISRSFADELCNIIQQTGALVLNMQPIVKNMYDTVRKGRQRQRERTDNDGDVVTFPNSQAFMSFLTSF